MGQTVTVDEVMQLLAKHPPDLRVVVNGYENSYNDLSPEQLSVVRIALYTMGQAAQEPELSGRRWARQHRCGRSTGPAAHIEMRGTVQTAEKHFVASQERVKPTPVVGRREVTLGECAKFIRDLVLPSVKGDGLYVGLSHDLRVLHLRVFRLDSLIVEDAYAY